MPLCLVCLILFATPIRFSVNAAFIGVLPVIIIIQIILICAVETISGFSNQDMFTIDTDTLFDVVAVGKKETLAIHVVNVRPSQQYARPK